MNNNKGVLQRPSERRLNATSTLEKVSTDTIQIKPIEQKEIEKVTVVQKKPSFALGLLTILLLISYIFTLKTYEPVNNIMITGGIIVYPLTFLVLAYVFRYYGFKETRKCIFGSVLLFIIFMLLTAICVIPKANNQTSNYNAVVQYLYTNNFFMLGNTKIFYPTLGQFFGIITAFTISHLLFATIYNAIHKYTVDYLAIGLSVFIAAITDRIIFMPILFLENLMSGANTFDYFLKCLTSEFMATIIATIIIIMLYVIITSIKDSRKKA